MKEFEIINFFSNRLCDFDLYYTKKELRIEGLRIDIFAIGQDRTPYIIEIKREKNRHIVGQASQYLSLALMYCKKIEKDIGFFDINWKELKILCFAPDFYERDYSVYNSEPLKGKIHFYRFEIIKNDTGIILLDFEYAGPEKQGPLKLNQLINKNDLIIMKNEYYNYKEVYTRDMYYLKTIVPVFESIKEQLLEYQKIGFYVHWLRTKENINEHNFFRLFLSTNQIDTESSLGSSIYIDFFDNEILYGFELPNNKFKEVNKFISYLKEKSNNDLFIKNLLKFKDFDIFFPNANSRHLIPIGLLNKKGIEKMIRKYEPDKDNNDRFSIDKLYEKEVMFESDIKQIFNKGYKKFNFLFEIIK
jgi:hypothetical protein